MINKGDIVKIKPQFQDEGDESFVWTAEENEDGGRVLLSTPFGGVYVKTEVFQTNMLVGVN